MAAVVEVVLVVVVVFAVEAVGVVVVIAMVAVVKVAVVVRGAVRPGGRARSSTGGSWRCTSWRRGCSRTP